MTMPMLAVAVVCVYDTTWTTSMHLLLQNNDHERPHTPAYTRERERECMDYSCIAPACAIRVILVFTIRFFVFQQIWEPHSENVSDL